MTDITIDQPNKGEGGKVIIDQQGAEIRLRNKNRVLDLDYAEGYVVNLASDIDTLLTALDEMLANGPAMQRGTNADGTPLMGTMREVMEDYKAAAEAEAKAADEARRENERLRETLEWYADRDGFGKDFLIYQKNDKSHYVISDVHQLGSRARSALAADEPKEPINMPRGARRTCDDGYPSCRMAEATGEWCFDVCLGVRVKSTSKEDALAADQSKDESK